MSDSRSVKDNAPSRRSNRSLLEQVAEAARRNPVLGPIARGAGALRRATLPKKAEELERRMRRGAAPDIETGPQDPFTLPPGLYINPNQEEEIVNIKKGGMVKAKAKTPVKKAMGGKVAAKPMGKPVMKKAGGRVAAKPMMKGRKK
jgi:hypothetical protein